MLRGLDGICGLSGAEHESLHTAQPPVPTLSAYGCSCGQLCENIMRTRATLWLVLFLISFAGATSARADVNDLLFVVGNSGSLTAGESSRKAFFEANGYTVTLISDGAAQAS